MSKTITTHLNPDLDAMTSVWLLKRFLPGWEDAEVKFVPAGLNSSTAQKSQTSNFQLPKTNDVEILWVDTGFGELDHHQTDKKTCAAVLTWKYIKSKVKIKKPKVQVKSQKIIDEKAVDRLVDVVLRIDYSAEDIILKNAADDFYAFLFNERQIIRGIRSMYRGQSEKHLQMGMQILDAVFEALKIKIEAEGYIKNGITFETKWGKALASVNNNEMYMHLAQEVGYSVVVAKDPKKGHIRIHALPNHGVDFTKAYLKLKKMDTEATWYLHTSKALLLNGSTANPDMRPTRLCLEEVVNILKKF